MGKTSSFSEHLELAHFKKAIEYIEACASGIKHLNAQELLQINSRAAGSGTTEDLWRTDAATIHLKTGRKKDFDVISNPLFRARDVISNSRQRAKNGEVVQAATDLYVHLVKAHIFRDANRRTAVAAVFWLLLENNIRVKAEDLLVFGLGDLEDDAQIAAVEKQIGVLVAEA